MPENTPKMPPLPEFDFVHDKRECEGEEALTPVERLVFIGGYGAAEDVSAFRADLQAALQEAFAAGHAAAMAKTAPTPIPSMGSSARRVPSPDFPGGF
ncbi:hypothetical protein [Geminicoccus flavidas]|uniref:hypothetical protein n=1 Tax=Geminicoccus flavidas TaxID=2506407 RepID=UPI0013593846|nr:hypothetical protein [Geminicoccus flavidas]